ncbi:MAG: MBL fold metallo-hydrolase, partial [Acidimicrobiales bacterium]
WSFESLAEGTTEVEGFTVLAREIPHKGGRTFGYRVSDGTSALAYLSDHAPQNIGPGEDGLGEYHAAARDLVDGVDVLIHDGQYTAAELSTRGYFGHAAAEYAAALAKECGARRLLLFHHDPSRTDPEVDDLLAGVRSTAKVPVDVARELQVVDTAGR